MKKTLVGITFVVLLLIAAWPLVAQEQVPEEVTDPNDPNLRWCLEGTWFGPCREIEGWTVDDPRQTWPPPVGSKEREMGRKAREAKAREVLPECSEDPGGSGYCIDSDGSVYGPHSSSCVHGVDWGICADENGKLGSGDRLPNGIEVP